jgi:uncharacterized protein
MVVGIISKLIKQRKESIKSFIDGGRQDLADAEKIECDFISSYLPAQMSAEEVGKVIDEVIARLGASTVKDMGKVMAEAKSQLMGKTDISEVGSLVKQKLGGGK